MKLSSIIGGKMNLKKVIVKWKDITFYNGTYKLEDIKEHGCKIIETLGYLIKRDKDEVIICCSQEKTEEDNVMDCYIIPKGVIIELKFVK